MPECGYCEASFDDGDAYTAHLEADHADELGPIDRRRVGVTVVLSSGESVQEPYDLGSVHHHGTMDVVVNGERVDFSRSRYQLQADPFHFEGGEGTRWHVHARGVTLAYAMDTLGIDVTASTVTYRDTTYRDSDPNTTVTVTVNGEPVTPSDHVLREGDRVRVVVDGS